MKFTISDKMQPLSPSAIREIFKSIGEGGVISFAGGNPAAESVPVKELADIAADIFANGGGSPFQYGISEGYTPYRDTLKARMRDMYGCMKDYDDLIILSGGQQGMDLVSKCLLNEGDTVITETPSFIGSLNAFRSYGAKLRGVPVLDDGIDVDELERALKEEKRVKFIYVIPNFQNPTGITMSGEKRRRVYELAVQYNVPVLEDNPYGEIRFEGEFLPNIKSLDREGAVVYIGSMSKVLSSGMRQGYAVAQSDLIAKMTVAKQVTDVHTNLFFQMVANEFFKRYDFEAHLERIRGMYRVRCKAMLAAIDKYFPKGIAHTKPEGGLFIWCTFDKPTDVDAFIKRAAAAKIAVVNGSVLMADDRYNPPSFRLNFSMPTLDEIERGISTLGEILKEFV